MRCKKCHNSGAMMLISMVISPQNIAKNMVLTYLHFRILDPLENLPLIMNMSLYQFIMGRIYGPYHHPINFGWYSYKCHISYKCHFMIYHFLKLPLIMNISLYKCHQFMPSIHVIHGISHCHSIHVWYIYSNIWGILMGSMSPYIAAPWILWDCHFRSIWRTKRSQVCRSPWAATDRSQARWSRRAPGKGYHQLVDLKIDQPTNRVGITCIKCIKLL